MAFFPLRGGKNQGSPSSSRDEVIATGKRRGAMRWRNSRLIVQVSKLIRTTCIVACHVDPNH